MISVSFPDSGKSINITLEDGVEAVIVTAQINNVTIINDDSLSAQNAIISKQQADIATQKALDIQNDTTIARKNQSNVFTKMQIVSPTEKASLDIDLTNDTNLIVCTPIADGTLNFLNIQDNTSGRIILINPNAHIISLGAMVKAVSGTASSLSSSGTYLLSFDCYGGNVYISKSGLME